MPEASPGQKGKRGKRRIVQPSATQPRTREDADLGVKKCLALMTTGQWVTGVSNLEVAQQFGVSPATVKDWATSASRIMRLCIEDDDAREDIRARMVATLDSTVKSSIGDVRFGNRTVVAAIETQAKLLGLVEEKHKHDITMQTKELQGLPPAALLARVRDQIAKLRELETKLAAEVEGGSSPRSCEREGCTLDNGHFGACVTRTVDPTRLAGMQLVTSLPSGPGEMFGINRPGPEQRLAGQRFEGVQLQGEHGPINVTTGEKR